MSGDATSPGISRLDQEAVATHGWQVRIQSKGVRFGRFFSDRLWGGREGSREAAIRYRDRLLSRIERDRQSAAISTRSRQLPDQRNRSGVVGVSRVVQRSARGTEYHFWQASWTTADGRRVVVRFSVLKHGEDQARELACETRRKAGGEPPSRR